MRGAALLGLALAGDVYLIFTTVAPPTDAVKAWTELKGWHVVAVADLKTPEAEHRALAAKVPTYHFLSVDEQKAMEVEFPSLRHVGWRAYQRKQAGYLFAIKRGASVIYETDDDNAPLRAGSDMVAPARLAAGEADQPAAIRATPEMERGAGNLSAASLVNTYGCFGRGELWPRGFPLSHLQWFLEEPESPAAAACEREPAPAVYAPVQQSLQDKDPDVDGIYRLTHAARIRGGVDFGKGRPLALAPGEVCPFNTQNTAFYPEAFWGLVIPIDVTFRECDIVRGWWVQRMLWDIGARLLFRESTVRHDRNSHDYFQDFILEKKLYFEATPFLKFLLDWKSTAPTLDERIRNLAEGLAAAGHWGPRNVALIADWLADLRSLNYTFPTPVSEPWPARAEL
jgi:hypothetical protein